MKMDVSVIIVNYNTASCVKECIESVLKQKNVSFEIFVVDNASTDNSKDILSGFGDCIHAIFNPNNLGFSKANNLAAEQAQGDYLLIFNPDAKFETEYDLQHLVSCLKEHAQYGLLVPRILRSDGKETLPHKHYVGEKYLDYPFNGLPGTIAWALGACLLIPTKIYKDINGFDEDFFLYAEDADLCLRIRKFGLEIGYCPSIIVQHVGSASEHQTSWYDKAVKKQESLYIFCRKHYSKEQTKVVLTHIKRRVKRHLMANAFMRLLSLGLLKRMRNDRTNAIYDLTRRYLRELQ